MKIFFVLVIGFHLAFVKADNLLKNKFQDLDYDWINSFFDNVDNTSSTPDPDLDQSIQIGTIIPSGNFFSFVCYSILKL